MLCCGSAPWKIGMEPNIVSILGRLFASHPKTNYIIGQMQAWMPGCASPCRFSKIFLLRESRATYFPRVGARLQALRCPFPKEIASCLSQFMIRRRPLRCLNLGRDEMQGPIEKIGRHRKWTKYGFRCYERNE